MYNASIAAVVAVFGVLVSLPAFADSDCAQHAKESVAVVAETVAQLDTEGPAPPNLAESFALFQELQKTRQGIGGWDAPFQEDPPLRNGVDTIFVFSPKRGLKPYLVNYYDRPSQIRLRDQWYPVVISEDGTWSVPGLTHQLGSAHPATKEDIARDTSELTGYVRTEKGRLFLVTIPYF